jgi:hypothetical protein
MLIRGVTQTWAIMECLTHLSKPTSLNAGIANKAARPIEIYPIASKFQKSECGVWSSRLIASTEPWIFAGITVASWTA